MKCLRCFLVIVVLIFCAGCLKKSLPELLITAMEAAPEITLPDETLYPFHNPALAIDVRVENLFSLLTYEDKLTLLQHNPVAIPHLGITSAGLVTDCLGAVLGPDSAIPTTQFCQAYGLAETWDSYSIQLVARAVAVELRYAYHVLGIGGLVVQVPDAIFSKEDPCLNSTLTSALINGLQGDHPHYWRTAVMVDNKDKPPVPDDIDAALNSGLLTIADFNTAVRANLRIMTMLGLFDPPALVPYANVTDEAPWNTIRHKNLARVVEKKSIVLLKNEKAILPLTARKLKQIAVLGKFEAFSAIKAKAGVGCNVSYTADYSEAVALAKNADVAIVCIGNDPNTKQIDETFLQEVSQANPATIVVLISDFPYALTWADAHIPAILHMTHNSQELGNALADVLFGDYNPGGRLVQTWTAADSDIPLYDFGYGLSYTNFQYTNLRVNPPILAITNTLSISVDITNTGKRNGDEVVQMYVKHFDSAVIRPAKQLKGFARVFIEAGKTVTVNLNLHPEDISFWDATRKQWVLETGEIELQFARSANDADILLSKTIPVAGELIESNAESPTPALHP